MRILATGKRDSVSEEEVVVIASTERYNSRENNSSSGAIIISGANTTFIDLPGKLNGVGRSASNTLISSSLEKSKRKGKNNHQKLKKRLGQKKSSSSSCSCSNSSGGSTKSPCSWRNRAVGKSVAFILSVLNSHCCPVQKEGKVVGKAINICAEKGSEEKEKIAQGFKSAAPVVDPTRPPFSSTCSSVEQQESLNVTGRSTVTRDQIKFSGIANSKIMRSGIYHEKQVKSLCALHALNNLLQDGKAFKQEDLDKICSELDPNSWVNPHKSVFGLGNYDINVIMTALQQKKLETVWFDKRKDPSHELNFDNIYGYILNIPSDCRLGWLALPIKRKHWVAIRNLPSVTERDAGRSNYYNLDSKFDKPESIGTTDSLIDYLRGELKSPEKELFLVVTEDIGRLETWRKNPPPPPLLETAIASSSASASTTVAGSSSAAAGTTHLLPVPTGDDASAGSGNGNFRRTSNDSGVVDLLPDLRDINVVDLNKEDLMRRQSSGVWSDLT